MLRGKSRPCLYRFCISRTHDIELKGEEDDRRHVDDRLSRCSIAMDGQLSSTTFSVTKITVGSRVRVLSITSSEKSSHSRQHGETSQEGTHSIVSELILEESERRSEN